jgi:uroporphyrin-III C-methyltransferase/precorrin-2 dehydrogenase/sirohydrochlorin ferrochelatase
MSGRVSIVGAGPGDPELVTRRAARLLAEADLVLYDALVSPEVLALAPRAQRFSVGKRAGRASFRQEAIHSLMIRAARRGKRVVRLKGGDPFVFGRGGEEVLALRAAGVRYEVVPGISSAVAAPALAEIPVTHRGLASAFTVVSGHAEEAWRPVLTGLPANGLTLVVLMGRDARAAVAAFLIERGWKGSTPAALLLAAGTPEAHAWTGTLAELGRASVPRTLADAPGTIVIGEVVTLAAAHAATEAQEGASHALSR